MTTTGTAAYTLDSALPPRVTAAVTSARAAGFGNSCRPEQGRLLQVLARGAGAGTIGETGTGYGVGLAWLASTAAAEARLVSVERSVDRADAARATFRDDPRVEVRHGDWRNLAGAGPFDLLVLDGGGQGKGAEPPLDPAGWLRPGGLLVIDDFTPLTGWPPRLDGEIDTARLHWLDHPALRTTEIRLAPDLATLVGVYLGS
jgi:predicted O-methyltransferase YrrM